MSRPRRLAALALAAALLPACSGGGGGGEPGGTKFLSVGTAPPGGAFFVVGSAIADVLNAHGDDAWTVTAEATKGSQENIRRLDRGELDFALSNAAITYFAVRGTEGWERAYDVRAVATLAPNVALFITPEDSAVRSLADLAGRRVVLGPAGAGFEYFLSPLLAAHGLTYDDLTPLHATQAGAVDLLADGAAAAAFLGGAVPTASITQAAVSQDIRFVPFDADAVDELVERYLFFRPASIPAGTYRGQEEAFSGLDVGSMHLIASAHADPDLVYSVLATLYEQRDAVTERHPAGRALNPANAVRDTGTPFHPGAERYYREIGIWPESTAGEGAASGGGAPGGEAAEEPTPGS